MICFTNIIDWILNKKNKEIEAHFEKSFPSYVYPVHINILLNSVPTLIAKEDESVLQSTSIDDAMTIYNSKHEKLMKRYALLEIENKRYTKWTKKYLNDWLVEQLPSLIDMHQILSTIAKEVSVTGINHNPYDTFKIPLINKLWKPLNRFIIKQINIINKKMTRLGYTYGYGSGFINMYTSIRKEMSSAMQQLITSVVESSNANGQLKEYKFITEVKYSYYESEYMYNYGGFKVKALSEEEKSN